MTTINGQFKDLGRSAVYRREVVMVNNMSNECDPLLPRDRPAPEISGYGYSTSSSKKYQGNAEEEIEETTKLELQVNSRDSSPLSTTFGLFVIIVSLSIFVAFLVPGGLWSSLRDAKNETLSTKARVDSIMSKNPLIDGHNDLAIMLRFLYGNKIYEKNFTDRFEHGGLEFHVDIPRLRAGKSGGAFWSAYVQCPKNGTDFSDGTYVEAVATTLSQVDVLHRLTKSYPETFGSPTANTNTSLEGFRHGKLISPIGIEGLHQIGNSFSNLRLFESLGVRYATLTHNCHNAFADAALITNTSGTTVAAPPQWGGVSDAGRNIIQEMNRIGMLVDLSHVSKDTMLDVLGGQPEKWSGSRSPVMFSHSSAYSLCPHPRNVPDDVLSLVKKTNSVVMVNFSPDFISCIPSDSSTGLPDLYPQNSTLHQVARHIIHIGELIGYDHVGIGSDFDGIFDTPRGLEDVSKFPDLVAELLEMGVADEDAAKIIGMNILRVWNDAEETSKQMQKEGVLPVEDKIKKPHFL